MKTFLTVILPLLCLHVAHGEEPRVKWYHEFFLGEVLMSGEVFLANGKLVDKGTGKMVSAMNKDTGVIHSKTTVQFEKQPNPIQSVSTQSLNGKNQYVGKGKDSSGGKVEFTTKLLEGKKYRTEIKGAEGMTTVIDGTMKEDGTVTATEVIRAPNGAHLYTLKTVYRKAADQAKKVEEVGEAKR